MQNQTVKIWLRDILSYENGGARTIAYGSLEAAQSAEPVLEWSEGSDGRYYPVDTPAGPTVADVPIIWSQEVEI